MKMRLSHLFYVLFVVLAYGLFMLNSAVQAQESPFRKLFIEKMKANQFPALEYLVKTNKDSIPGEVKALVDEAMAEGKPFEERIELLEIALRMATMYDFIHGNGKDMIKEVEKLKRDEVKKQEVKLAEEKRWEKEEKRFLGNLIMKDHKEAMDAQGLAPVVYPHWIHRIYFKCKVCHDGIFIKIRGANKIAQAKILEGKQCGVCHNGTLAFGANKDCERCHMAGKPESDRLFDPRKADHAHIKEVAIRFGAEWDIENMPDKMIPTDRFHFIDWIKLKELKVINPIASLDKDFKEELKNTTIFFEALSPTVPDVLFDHKIHSWWLNCSTCHPRIFKDELGGNDMRMIDNARGKFCGDCHSKVSFTFADCFGCHSQPKGQPPQGALIRKKPVSEVPASGNAK